MTPNPLKKFEKWGHETLEPTDDEIYFSILRTLNERQKDWLFKYINSIRKEAAKGGSDSSRVAVGTKTDSSTPKPPRKSLKKDHKCKGGYNGCPICRRRGVSR